MSRSIEAAIGDPAAVSMPMLRLTAVSPGLKPFSAAIAQHSANILLANWLAPAAAISPKAPRIRQQMPAAAAMNAHFSHISCRIAVDNWESNLAPEKAAAIATTRGDFAPFCSPNERKCKSLRWRPLGLPAFRQRFGPVRPHQKSDVAAGFLEPAAEIAAER